MNLPRIPAAIVAAVLATAAPLCAADDHAGHSHGSAAGHTHGTPQAIGTVDINGRSVAVLAAGAVTAGAAWHIDLRLPKDQPAPKAIRLWVGIENGRGSVKAKAEVEKDEPGGYTAHVDVPNPIPADSRLWIAIEPAEGQAAKGSLVLPAAGHHAGDGHNH